MSTAAASRLSDTDFANCSLEQARSALWTGQTYLQLYGSLLPGYITSRPFKEMMDSFGELMDAAPEAEFRVAAVSVARIFDRLLEDARNRLPPKRPWEDIAVDYWHMCRDGTFSFSTGLAYGWLTDRFDCALLKIPADTPVHARIGVGHHAGTAAVEEDFLLCDAFFCLVKSRRALEQLKAQQQKAQESPAPDDTLPLLRGLAHNVAAYARLTVVSFYSFVECFINSVGQDFVARTPCLAQSDVECLRGRRNGRYIPTEKKLEGFPAVIRTDGLSPITVSDPNQLREPFLSFVGHVKSLRDASMHYSTEKARIWYSPTEWAALAESAASTCVAVARDFWDACYPGRGAPEYLDRLDETEHIRRAEIRCRDEEAAQCAGPVTAPG